MPRRAWGLQRAQRWNAVITRVWRPSALTFGGSLETSCCDACHDWAIGPALFSLGGPLARPAFAGGGYRRRTVDCGVHGHSEHLVQPLLQHPAKLRLGRFRQRDHLLLRPRSHLHRSRRLSDLSHTLAADPLAPLDDADLSAAMAQYREPLSHAASRRCRR